MREAHPLERRIGIDVYVSEADGVGGRLRARPEDFAVREIERLALEPPAADRDRFPHLVVRASLRNWETSEFASALSDRLGISRERISWAGTKDKRAVTTQLFSIDGIDAVDLPELPDADLEVAGRFGRSLRFGDLAGNRFAVVVREPDRPANARRVTAGLRRYGSEVGPATEGEAIGVPNFFGPQRFGSRRPITHTVGFRLLERDWEGAVLAYVGQPEATEPTATRTARRYVERTRDWTGALDRMPTHLGYERAMLHRLAEGAPSTEDYRAAIEAVPSSLQRLFVHAAQSYLFNRIVSERLANGLPVDTAIPGDVVCFAERIGDRIVPDPSRAQAVTGDDVAAVNRHCERGRAFVTAPLVGTQTALGDGEPARIVGDVLDDVGVEPTDFDLPSPFGSTGTRRPILARTAIGLTAVDDRVEFEFTLPSGSYATVVLREYLKTSPLAME